MFDHEKQELRLELLRLASSGHPLLDGKDAAGLVEAASCLEAYVLSGTGPQDHDRQRRVVGEGDQVVSINSAALDEHGVGKDLFPFCGGNGNDDISRKSGEGVAVLISHGESPVVGIDTATVSEGGDGVKPSPPEAA